MKLEELIKNPDKGYIHLERYVNKGSPSGFTGKYTTSPETRAKGENQNFYLCSVDLPDSIFVEDFGEIPEFAKKWGMIVHPDMIGDDLFSICENVNRKAVLVAPISSERTVKALEEEGWFFKLSYKGLIGRFPRQIAKKQAMSAVEVTKIIQESIEKKRLPNTFYFMREVGAKVIYLPFDDTLYEWGVVFRDPSPYPKNKDLEIVIPGFSLFSRDEIEPEDPTILTQLISNQNKGVEDYLFEGLIKPVLEGYYSLLLKCGLQMEAHAQNILFGFDKNFSVLGIIARDAESIDKDLSLIQDLNLNIVIQSREWKCLTREQYNYHIMHSFMFDFKLGEYLITPIITEALKFFSFDASVLIERIRHFSHQYLGSLPDDFFPSDGKWYSYESILHDRSKKRNYIAKENPQYR